MAIRVGKDQDVRTTVPTTWTRIDAGDDVRTIWVKSEATLYLAYSNTLADGDAVTSSRGFLIAANESWPISVGQTRPLIASVAGTVALTLLGRAE